MTKNDFFITSFPCVIKTYENSDSKIIKRHNYIEKINNVIGM